MGATAQALPPGGHRFSWSHCVLVPLIGVAQSLGKGGYHIAALVVVRMLGEVIGEARTRGVN